MPLLFSRQLRALDIASIRDKESKAFVITLADTRSFPICHRNKQDKKSTTPISSNESHIRLIKHVVNI